tara:strand:- start:261 stop:1070 length:810 start_codon:yes stop_codon:yes gene_type:complete
MLKKRIIFSLLYCDGYFVQSRNFNLQIVGDTKWLEKNYDFKKISYFIDELIILDISREKKNLDFFLKELNLISKICFMPVAVGGGIDNLDKAKKILSNGADKVVINTNLNLKLTNQISKTYGQQSIIASIDVKKNNNRYKVLKQNGEYELNYSLKNYLNIINNFPVGEIMINSIDQDGTGNGLDFKILDFMPKKINKSIIMSGGCGNSLHLSDGLKNEKIDAVNTANLLNFLGDGLKNAREEMIKNNFMLPIWDVKIINKLSKKLHRVK